MTDGDLDDVTVFLVGDDPTLLQEIALGFVRAGTQRIGIACPDESSASTAATAVFQAASGIWAVPASGDLVSAPDSERIVAELTASLGDPDIIVLGTADPEHITRVVGESAQEQPVVIRIDNEATGSRETDQALGVAPRPGVTIGTIATDVVRGAATMVRRRTS